MKIDLNKATTPEDVARAFQPIHDAIDEARATGEPVFLHLIVVSGPGAEDVPELPRPVGMSRSACLAMARYWEAQAARARR